MPSETIQYLVGNPDGVFVDCTFGGGGHSSLILKKFPDAKVIAFDWDGDTKENFEKITAKFGERLVLIRDNFKNIKSALAKINVSKVDGILADVGVSSKQFDDLDRGFSFNSSVLDMRMDKRGEITAKEIINSYPQEELADIFYKYGQEHRSRQIAKAIYERRRRGVINTAVELQSVIASAKRPEGKINPATKVFQALRIFINGELDNLTQLLEDAPSVLNKGGRVAIISFHSLEDSIVKNNFKANASEGIYKILTKKVVTAGFEETKENPRSRSAKLRAAELI